MIHTDGIPTIANCGPIAGVDVKVKPTASERIRERRLLLDDIISYEDGAFDLDETVELFQRLVDSGLAWSLQGHYGRTASSLIASGLVTVAA